METSLLILWYSNDVDFKTDGLYGYNHLFLSREVFSEVLDAKECIMSMFLVVIFQKY